MRRVFSLLLTCSALLLFHDAAARHQSRGAEPQPPAPCDDSVRKELYGRFRENFKGGAEQKLEAYKAAKEYVCRCAEYDDVTLYLSNWMANYANPHYFYPNARAAAEAVAREDAKRPRCRCDEMREQLIKSLGERYRDETSEQNFKAAKKFLNICGDTRRPFDRHLRDWLGKYGRAVREFEEKRQKGEAPAKGPAKEP
jgi:hypothetical protein